MAIYDDGSRINVTTDHEFGFVSVHVEINPSQIERYTYRRIKLRVHFSILQLPSS